MAEEALKRTPLHSLHVELGAKMVPFAGYDMPVQYPIGILTEHQHTLARAGLFDVSHMGQLRLTAKPGADTATALERVVTSDIRGLGQARTRYALFTNDQAGILDAVDGERLRLPGHSPSMTAADKPRGIPDHARPCSHAP